MNQTSNTVIFSLAYNPFVGGAELAVEEITSRLSGHKFTCLAYKFDKNWKNREKHENVDIIRLGVGNNTYYGKTGAKLLYIYKAWREAEKQHKETPFTLIWAIMASYGGMAALLFKIRHPLIPLLLTLQEGDSEKHILGRVGFLYPLWRLLFKRADAVQVISNYLSDFGRRHGVICPIHVIPNGVSNFSYKKTKKKNKEKIIITTSRLVHKNGIDTLIYAFEKLKNLLPNEKLRLWIVGGGPQEASLQELARKLGIAEQVQFFGHVKPERIPELLSQADVFVRASRSEGLGSSFLEAMAAELPIIGTNVGGIPDFLESEKTGLFANVDDSHDVAIKIHRFLTDRALRSKCIRNGKKIIDQRYKWDDIAKQMNTIFISLENCTSTLIVSGIFPPEIGGTASYSNLLHRRLKNEGIRTGIITYGENRSGIISISRKWPKGMRHFIYFLRILLVSRRYKTILSADASFGAGFPAALAARVLGKQFIVRVTGDYAWEQGRLRFGVTDSIDTFQGKKYGASVEILRWFQKFTVGVADIVIAPSEYLRRLTKGWGVVKEKSIVIYNSIEDIEKFDKKKTRKELELHDTVIVSAGRLVPWKGFSNVLKAVAILRKNNKNITLVIIGDGPEKKKLHEEAHSLHIEKYTLFTGSISRETVGKYLAAADVFVLDTGYEGLSHQIIEALLYGVPVITTNVGGNPEIKKYAKETITLLQHGDIDALQKAIDEIITKDKKTTQPQKIKEIFSSDRMITAVTTILKKS